VTDLRDQLADFDAAARRLLNQPPRPRLVAVHARPATCHPDRPYFARTLCLGCYDHHRNSGTLHHYPRQQRSTTEFAADYTLLRSEGHTRRQIAERLGMRRNTVDAAYARAVRRGLLTRDPPVIVGHVRTSVFNPRELDDQINRRTA
jgi:DNA-binding CsgD family transcriptional regulator